MNKIATAALLLTMGISGAVAQGTTPNPGATTNPQAPPSAVPGRDSTTAQPANPGPTNNVVKASTNSGKDPSYYRIDDVQVEFCVCICYADPRKHDREVI